MNRYSRLHLLLWTLLLIVTGGCTPSGSGDPVGDGAARFPIIGNDPDGLVATMEWGVTPAIEPFPAGESTVLEVLGTSTPEVVQIAVEGNECPPSARVLVTGSPSQVTIELVLGGSLPPVGHACADILTTHALVIYFNEPVDLDNLEVSASRPGE